MYAGTLDMLGLLENVTEAALAKFIALLVLHGIVLGALHVQITLECCKKKTVPVPSKAQRVSSNATPKTAESPAAGPPKTPATPAAPADKPPPSMETPSAGGHEEPGALPATPAKNKNVKSMIQSTQMASGKSKIHKSKSKKSSKKGHKTNRVMESEQPQATDKGDDSLARHKPKQQEAKRAAEIEAKGTVARERDDYKTIKGGMPTSDFEKSLNLPEGDLPNKDAVKEGSKKGNEDGPKGKEKEKEKEKTAENPEDDKKPE